MNEARAGWLAVAGLLAVFDAAQAFEIKGAYGDVEGCRMHRGEYVTSDERHLVTSSEISNYATACDIVQLLPTKSGASAVAVGLCGYEGEGYLGVEHFALTFAHTENETDKPNLIVYQETGDLWGEFAPCD